MIARHDEHARTVSISDAANREIGIQPYAERWTECGRRRNPTCLPSRSKSISEVMRLGLPGISGSSGLPSQATRR
jgi:hypothetical protein